MPTLHTSAIAAVVVASTPGANTSSALPKLEKCAALPFGSAAPTVMQLPEPAGENWFEFSAVLPAAHTTGMP